MGQLHHIPAGRPFASDLASGIRGLVTSPEDLADAIILLPSRRLAQALRVAFLRDGGGRAELLPTMAPIGDLEEDAAELAIAGWDRDDLPPVIPSLERKLMLARKLADPSRSMTETLSLAGALSDFLDQAQTAGCDMSRLADLVQEADLASHWQKLLSLLGLLMQWWPLELQRIGKSDPVLWRDAAIRARAEAWGDQPPKGLVIIAGSTGSLPATRVLMQSVLQLERGHIVLPGLDSGMPDDDWGGLTGGKDETAICHPQYQLAQLLDAIGISHDAIPPWPASVRDGPDTGVKPRLDLLREVFRPASQTGEWQKIPDRGVISRKGLSGMALLDCYDHREEAEVIALAMREALETPGRTAALVTADRVLARMVSGELSRWGVLVDDSAGTSLADTGAAQFLRLILDAWMEGFSPRPLLALLQHPLAASGMAKPDFRQKVRQIDRLLLRGPRPEGGLDGLLEKAKALDGDLARFVRMHVIDPLRPLTELEDHETIGLAPIGLARCADALGKSAENLAALPDNPLAAWQGQSGMRVARFLQHLATGGDAAGVEVTLAEMPAAITALMRGETIYPDRIDHPRLAIMGMVEARMHTADLMIMGGMNEGTSPPHAPGDPWMSNAMRVEFGLPPAHWRVGPAAHDAYMVMAMPDVLITRSARLDGAPTEMSRWLRRLDAVLDVARLDRPDAARYQRIARTMNAATGPVCPAPCPEPVLDQATRPRRFSATELDTLQKDPYAIYARKVLGLKALDPLDQPPSAADRGSFIHDALKVFTQRFPDGPMPENALRQLLADGRDELEKLPRNPWVEKFWWPQFEAIARWFVAMEKSREDGIIERHAEIRGEMELPGLTAPYTLTARADRIDVLPGGYARIIDYKTGLVPGRSAVNGGRALQLIVEAVLAQGGHFNGIDDALNIAALEYWKLTGKDREPGKPEDRTPDQAMLADAGDGLTRLLHQFDQDTEPYPPEPFASEANPYSDYRHLARVGEWRLNEGEGEE